MKTTVKEEDDDDDECRTSLAIPAFSFFSFLRLPLKMLVSLSSPRPMLVLSVQYSAFLPSSVSDDLWMDQYIFIIQ